MILLAVLFLVSITVLLLIYSCAVSSSVADDIMDDV